MNRLCKIATERNTFTGVYLGNSNIDAPSHEFRMRGNWNRIHSRVASTVFHVSGWSCVINDLLSCLFCSRFGNSHRAMKEETGVACVIQYIRSIRFLHSPNKSWSMSLCMAGPHCLPRVLCIHHSATRRPTKNEWKNIAHSPPLWLHKNYDPAIHLSNVMFARTVWYECCAKSNR